MPAVADRKARLSLLRQAAAQYGIRHGVPLPYRAQTVRSEISEAEIADCPEGPCRAWLAIRQMNPSFVTHEPRPHEGLGLEAYVQATSPIRRICIDYTYTYTIQATSPIRRYADLAVHYQLKAHL